MKQNKTEDLGTKIFNLNFIGKNIRFPSRTNHDL